MPFDTRGCTNATSAASQEFCQGVDRLGAELGTAAMAAVLAEKVEKLNFSIGRLRDQGAGQIADPQSFGFELMFGLEQNVVRTGLSILLALVVESVCCFGLLVMVSEPPHVGLREELSLPEWLGRWLTDRAEPHPDGQVSFAVLEEDFRDWGRGREAPRLGSWRFRRLLRAACKEIGLPVQRRVVVGLRLVPVARMLTVE
jgi:hypothetical protein